MNKYAAMGLIREAVKGRRIVVLTGAHSGEERFAFAELGSLLKDSDELLAVARRNGLQGFTLRGGGCIDLRRTPQDLRGCSYDVIYLDTEIAHAVTEDEIHRDLLPVISPSDRGELVRA